MVLNLLRLEEINPEFMLEKSFYQFQNYGAIPEMIDSKSLILCFYYLLFSCFKSKQLSDRAHSLVVSGLRLEIKGSRFKSDCRLCIEVSSPQQLPG